MKKLFVIGDSISCYYGKYLEKMLCGIVEYDRKGASHVLEDLDDCTNGINGGDSSMVLTYLKEVVKQSWFKPDYLLLNCGLHDTKLKNGSLQIPPVQYRANLEAILQLARKRNIKVIWVRTTPVNENTALCPEDEVQRRKRDIERYNQAADEIMADYHVPVIDLYSFTLNLGTDIFLNRDDPVHFNNAAAEQQAAFIAGALFMFKQAEIESMTDMIS